MDLRNVPVAQTSELSAPLQGLSQGGASSHGARTPLRKSASLAETLEETHRSIWHKFSYGFKSLISSANTPLLVSMIPEGSDIGAS